MARSKVNPRGKDIKKPFGVGVCKSGDQERIEPLRHQKYEMRSDLDRGLLRIKRDRLFVIQYSRLRKVSRRDYKEPLTALFNCKNIYEKLKKFTEKY